MTNRRDMLALLAASTIPAVALGVSAQEKHGAHHNKPDTDKNRDCVRPGGGPYAEYFPNVVVHTHDGRKALFYQDLLRGKTVLVNCMSVKNEAKYPVTSNLVRVQQLLGERLGRDVFMYSLTVDPENDTPRVLRAFAEKHKVRPGWSFLSAKLEDVQLLRGRLFSHDAAHSLGSTVVRDCSMGLVRYGNETVGLWGSVPAKADPEWIVKRLSWVDSRPPAPAEMTFKRRGPIGQAPVNQRSQDSSKRS